MLPDAHIAPQTTRGNPNVTLGLPLEIQGVIFPGKRGGQRLPLASESRLYKIILRAQRSNPLAKDFPKLDCQVRHPSGPQKNFRTSPHMGNHPIFNALASCQPWRCLIKNRKEHPVTTPNRTFNDAAIALFRSPQRHGPS